MPSDAVTIAVAFTAPAAAGVVAVALHRQRLAHERRQDDLAVVREILARGAASGMELERAARDWLYAEHAPARPPDLPLPTDPLVEKLDRAAHEWRVT